MVEDKRSGRNVRWSARIAFAAGVAASVAANIAAAQPTLGARIVAAWPAVAMLLVVEMLSRSRPTLHQAEATAGPEDCEDAGSKGGPWPAAMSPAADTTADDPGQNSQLDQAHDDNGGPSALEAPQRSRQRGHAERTADAVARLRVERPDASLADIAAEAGVSERHVRRLLTSRT